ncbi:MerC domain-containing protein [uncultured Erythrobacter sp.]|uniref:MerC domain-containing protein n=1 Tax=uncultured Erythrobacter sp. TaxID=263913 RepID=UPI0026089BB7|nr:MerC domain-containing protein [uncultured Erythrobacter sp.]
MTETQDTNSAIRRHLDKTGIAISALCAVHCVLTIIIVSGLGVGGQFFFSEEIHRYALVVALIIAAVGIGWGALMHRRREPFVIAMMGLSFMGGALASPHGTQEAILTIIGVALVSLGHLLNLRAHK